MGLMIALYKSSLFSIVSLDFLPISQFIIDHNVDGRLILVDGILAEILYVGSCNTFSTIICSSSTKMSFRKPEGMGKSVALC